MPKVHSSTNRNFSSFRWYFFPSGPRLQCLRITVTYIYFWLVFLKSLGSVNLSLDLHVVSIFWVESDTSGTSSLYFPQTCLKLERPDLEGHIRWYKTGIYSFWKESFWKGTLDARRSNSGSISLQTESYQLLFYP